ncbi:MAG: EAL domain-containing protein [Bacilli bacterium]|nr:EAL domain-containing protein [Bacilli bacterium]
MDKKLKGRLILFLIIVFALVSSFVVTIFLLHFGVVKATYENVIIITTLLSFGVLASFVFAQFYSEKRTIEQIKKENTYYLHRNTPFFNYDMFTRILSQFWKNLSKKDGYMLAFKCAKGSDNDAFSIETIAELNGAISDYLTREFEEKQKGRFKRDTFYCYYRGTFLLYTFGDNVNLDHLISGIEDEAYRVEAEKDLRMFIQPNFGIAEFHAGDEVNIYELATRALSAREIAEKNFAISVTFVPEMKETVGESESKEISDAIDRGEFVVYYQPKFNLKQRRFTSSEALIRWNSPERGLLSPMKFINKAEKSGLIHKLDMYVLETVCKDLAETKRKGLRLLPVSINFSIYEFYGPNFVDGLFEMIDHYNVDPHLIELEVTESTTGVNQFLSISILKRIRERGIRILMDDFGVGYSNFSNLRNLPFDVLKVDKSLVDDIVVDTTAREITRFIINLGIQIGMEVIAEGVDNEKQVEILKECNLDTIQGYYYSRPIPKADYMKLLKSNPFEKKEMRTK